MACAVKETNPKIEIIGVQTSKLPSMKAAIENNGPVTLPPKVTIADGIAVRVRGIGDVSAGETIRRRIVTVDEEEIANAILLILEKEKL